MLIFFFQAEDGIRDLVRSRGLGDVYKRQVSFDELLSGFSGGFIFENSSIDSVTADSEKGLYTCLLYTSDAADERV